MFSRPQQNRRNTRVGAVEVAPRDRDRLPLEDSRPREDRLRGRHPRRGHRCTSFC